MTKRILIKLGGAALNTDVALEQVSNALLHLRQQDSSEIILVHGGGPAINQELEKRGISWTFENGQRVTSAEMAEVIHEVLGQQVNTRIVDFLKQKGVPTIGISGSQQETLLCTPLSARLGFVGEVQKVNIHWIEDLLQREEGLVPVIAPLGIGRESQKYNINADWAAAHLAVALKVDELVFLTDQDGVYDEIKNLIPQLSLGDIQHMVEQKIATGGMLTKLLAVQFALKSGIPQVRIAKAADAKNVLQNQKLGTIFQQQDKPYFYSHKEIIDATT